jgi:hypothetical protein
MKHLIPFLLVVFSSSVFSETCDFAVAEALEKRWIELKAETILENRFSYITSLSDLRKATVAAKAFEVVEKIDQELVLRLTEVIHFSQKSSSAQINEVLSAYDKFQDDQSYYPLTWKSADKDALESLVVKLRNDV